MVAVPPPSYETGDANGAQKRMGQSSQRRNHQRLLPLVRFTLFAHFVLWFVIRRDRQGSRASFGIQWWQHREWAKTNLYEWLRLAWWGLIDRWRWQAPTKKEVSRSKLF